MDSEQASGLRRTLFVNLAQDSQDEIVLVAKALSSPTRLQILEYLQDKNANEFKVETAREITILFVRPFSSTTKTRLI